MTDVYIALGTNIEPRESRLQQAMNLLAANSRITIQAASDIYETAPVGYTDQADFLNMVLHINTDLAAIDLLDACQEVETELKRKRTIRFGPRTIDVDIILYHDDILQSERLTIPHPRMHERAFVLTPLAELAPEKEVPGTGQSVDDFLQARPEAERQSVVPWTKSN